MALMGKRHQSTDSVQDVFADPTGSLRVRLGEKFPDVGNILRCQRVQDKTLAFAHGGEGFFSKASSR
jgi:hypothetical protein